MGNSNVFNSACNCCTTPPRWDFSEVPPSPNFDFIAGIRSRTKGATVAPCGIENPDDGKYYKVYTETYELGSQTRTYTYDPITNTCTEDIDLDIPEGGGEGEIQSIIYSGEITAEELMGYAETRFALAEYSEWNDTATPTAFRYQDFNGAGIQEAEVQVFHPPSFSAFFKVWIDKITFEWNTEQNGFINPSNDKYSEYEWSGEPASNQHSVNAEENKVYGESFILTAEENEQISLYIRKFSFLPNYEPDDPVFNEENSQFERPDPDCRSNGVPTVNETCPASLFVV